MEQTSIYHDYSQADPEHQSLYLDTILRHLHDCGPMARVLDAGCGDGNFTASLSKAGFQMSGFDGSEGGIAKARLKYPNIAFNCGSLYDDLCAPFGGGRFDAIVSIEVIEHLYSPRKFLQRARDALREDGLLIITTPYWGYLKNVLLALTNRMDRALTTRWEGGHIKHWSYSSLRLAIEENGFEFVAFHGAGRLPYCWNGMVMVARRAA